MKIEVLQSSKRRRVAICCKSGRHRSVTFANMLHKKLQSKEKLDNESIDVLLEHLALDPENPTYDRTPVR
jgi:RNase adaptor protein for sRNA GlmZ degradation